MRIVKRFSVFVFLFFCFQVSATMGQGRSTPAFKFLFSGALEFGGDVLAEIAFQDGSTQKMMAGQGGSIYAGGQYSVTADDRWMVRGLVGYKFLTTKATNTSITLTRVPIRVTGMYKVTPKFWIGGGVATHTMVKFNGGSIAANETFKSGLGGIIDIGYSNFSFTYTSMSYQDHLNKSYNAGSFGLYVYIPVEKRRK